MLVNIEKLIVRTIGVVVISLMTEIPGHFDLCPGGCWRSGIKPNFPVSLTGNLVKCKKWLSKNPELSSNVIKSINLFLILFVASTDRSIIRETSLYFILYWLSYVVSILMLIYIQWIHVCSPHMLLAQGHTPLCVTLTHEYVLLALWDHLQERYT